MAGTLPDSRPERRRAKSPRLRPQNRAGGQRAYRSLNRVDTSPPAAPSSNWKPWGCCTAPNSERTGRYYTLAELTATLILLLRLLLRLKRNF
jgi:hypothetical protein